MKASESQNVKYKRSWHDECLKCVRGLCQEEDGE